ncbi:RcnB family protein [Sphingomonas sp. SUN039]|uniref:RcnB family protein n=1 Tax=Sphingomonas sp. SUN039 TaxID=2937787 RepID=UPI002164BD88|nr:RcnB family protein [Sphingomonas sp. SUN039]UVO54847.1 RcnB family protein [Sphingomonas sp. SUN039]
MARLAIAGVIGALTLIPTVAMAQMDSRVGAPPMPAMPPMAAPMPHGPGAMPQMPPMARPAMPPMGQPQMPPMGRPGPMPGPGGDRWGAVPGGWGAYRAPAYGYTLPPYWTAPTYYISDYGAFGLPAPAWGFGWSRYYDDMVLTDRWGRVYDWRDGRDMRGDDRGDYRPRKRDKSGIVGAVIGGAVGALTGNLIAGAGSRLAGSLIGGGLGALAGQAIDSGKIGGRDGYDDGRYGRGGHYGGGYRMQGPHWSMGESGGGYYGGCGCGQTVTTTTTTTYAMPVVTRRVSYVTEYVRVPVKQRVRYAPVRTKERYLGGS